jgi:hypothetical protein
MSDRRSAGSSVGECGRGRSELLGRVSPLARAFSGAVMVGFFVFSWGWVAAPPDTARDILNVTPALGLVILSAYLAFSADIRITRAGYVQVDGVVLKRSFPASQILKLSADEGLRFHLKSEKNHPVGCLSRLRRRHGCPSRSIRPGTFSPTTDR